MVYCTRNRAVRDTNKRMRRVLVPAEYLIYTAVNLDDEGGLRSSVVSWHISIGGQEIPRDVSLRERRLGDRPHPRRPTIRSFQTTAKANFSATVVWGSSL
jgi:hypothetical protein